MAGNPGIEAREILFPREGAVVLQGIASSVELRTVGLGSIAVGAGIAHHEDVCWIEPELFDDLSENLILGRRGTLDELEIVGQLA